MAKRSTSVLPPELSHRLARLKAHAGSNAGQELKEVLDELAKLPAESIARASSEIAASARLDRRLSRNAPIRVVPRGRFSLPLSWKVFAFDRIKKDPPTERDLLKINPDYAWLFLFHPNGHIREAALWHINTPPRSPFFLAALAWRLNDWVGQVRQAARRCIERIGAGVSSEVAAETGLYLLSRHLIWGRWRDEAKTLDRILAREDVIAAIADRLRMRTTGPMAACLRNALRHPGIDRHLPALAAQAIQPSVRAVAYQSLISGKARWQTGYDWIWVDRVYGSRKRVPAFGTRELERSRPMASDIADGLRDRSAFVRKIVADAMIVVRAELPDERGVVALIADDPSPAVRSRADFMLRHPAAQSVSSTGEV
ncbi:hypothetical protein [Bradyrhizobium sp. SSUT77]|uniref:hypothetical protein n=1 Tax=Bradyrhizobium sp. SSUT77 TaxID=3040603 RepID=UPI00244C6F4F|nr:hypothetical protein [Bradyrhizobium sp. SSUT77]MDH2344904.1 hypothetical protein [Bradyrhizobium sp. SSUT77]